MGDGNPLITAQDWMQSNFSTSENILLHFYCKELSKEEFIKLEKRGLEAKEYGVEVLGLIRVPLYTRKRNNGGLPMFLKNNFAGNARDNLLLTLAVKNILTAEEIQKCCI